MEAVSKEYIKNKYCISIVKCCASCKHKGYSNDERFRNCGKGLGKHRPDYLCRDCWEMSEKLENAGKGGGQVKKPSYIQYVIQNGFNRKEEFEMQYGSVYLTKR